MMNKGKIVQVMGPVVDVQFDNGSLPLIKDALTVEVDGKNKVMEVAQHMGNNIVRCIMLDVVKVLKRICRLLLLVVVLRYLLVMQH